jgi:hypothetical protein
MRVESRLAMEDLLDYPVALLESSVPARASTR